MNKATFDQVFAAWVGYDENDKREEKPLGPILKHFGVTENEFLDALARRTGSIVAPAEVDVSSAWLKIQDFIRQQLNSKYLMEADIKYNRATGSASVLTMVDAHDELQSIEVTLIKYSTDGTQVIPTIEVKRGFEKSDDAFAFYDEIKSQVKI